MSLPPELRALCFQLSSTPAADLPRLTPTLSRHVLQCQIPLSSPAGNAAKADAPASSVLVHKLKTQLSTLLNGKSSEGRFTAVVLIKAVVEVGGWEILRGAESWVRGLLSLLGVRKCQPDSSELKLTAIQKPESTVVKELCIIALTKIYCMTHPYQTLVREITTPTLPAFITSCLNLITSKSSSKTVNVPPSLRETIFRSFSMLLPRHTTIYRPFISQIRLATRPFLAPTLSDDLFVPQSLKESSQRLVVLLHQTAPKNAGGDEWGKAVRDLVRVVHETSDHAFRAVIEDWESTANYSSKAVDVNQPLNGGGKAVEDLPPWTGIHAGIERIIGMLEMLAEYFRSETSTPVAIPIGSIVDMVTRMLSIAIPSSLAESLNGHGAARLHPAIDRDERDGLWSGLPQIYVAALQLINTIAERMEQAFLPISQSCLDQLAWVFPFGRHSPAFRLTAYNLAAKTLLCIGQSFDKSQVGKLSGIIRSCCRDLHSVDSTFNNVGIAESAAKRSKAQLEGSNHNADTFLSTAITMPVGDLLEPTELVIAAGELLPLLLSHIPQRFLDISLRSLIERTAILTHNKGAMLASILNPFVGKNGKAMTSILPHLTREYGDDDVVEILLRPRMPLLPSKSTDLFAEQGVKEGSEDDEMDVYHEPDSGEGDMPPAAPFLPGTAAVAAHPGLGPFANNPDAEGSQPEPAVFGSNGPHDSSFSIISSLPKTLGAPVKDYSAPENQTDVDMDQKDESSGDESVHLTMQLDTDSESDE
jgi:pre-rRNA-processing protein RIX1